MFSLMENTAAYQNAGIGTAWCLTDLGMVVFDRMQVHWKRTCQWKTFKLDGWPGMRMVTSVASDDSWTSSVGMIEKQENPWKEVDS